MEQTNVHLQDDASADIDLAASSACPGADQPHVSSERQQLTPGEARPRVEQYSSDIYESWTSLRAVVERHETTLRKRWLKRTTAQRKKVLLAAWPRMAGSHRPDIAAYKSICTCNSDAAKLEEARNAYMWPHINIEDLCGPKLFLLFLNARGRTDPHHFHSSDLESCRFGVVSKKLRLLAVDGYSLVCATRSDHPRRWRLVRTDEVRETPGMEGSQQSFDAVDGLLIIEVQARLYKFLLDCCRDMLRDMAEAAQVAPDAARQPEPDPVLGEEVGPISMAVASAETPYRTPTRSNLRQLRSILHAKLTASEDHLWSLREDPGYFASTVRDVKEHRTDAIKDRSGRPSAAWRNNEISLWQNVLGFALLSAHVDVEKWATLLQKVCRFKDVIDKCPAASFSSGDDLPDEYAFVSDAALLHFDEFVKTPTSMFLSSFAASPPMRRFFLRGTDASGKTQVRLADHRALESNETLKNIAWLYNMLSDKTNLKAIGLKVWLDEFERLQASDREARDMITTWPASRISDMAVMSYCNHSLRFFHPEAPPADEDETTRLQERLKQDFAASLASYDGYLKCSVLTAAVELIDPKDGRYDYPADKARTKKNVDAMRKAEANLDEFWRLLDLSLVKAHESSNRVQHLLAERTLERTPEWVEPSKPHRPSQQPGSSLGAEHVSRALYELELSTEKTIDRTDKPTARVKPKTRGDPSPQVPPDPAVAAGAAEAAEADPQPTIVVDKRAMRVFKTIFHVPSTSSQPGEVHWTEFVHALCSAGFVAEKMYGSVWHFKPHSLDADRSIQFHEPHPEKKIPFFIAKRHGRRLNRAYGWDINTFVLKNGHPTE